MSLNGLDTAAVQDAYQAALVEAGGWFLLKYTSRDSVELLSRGKGGVHEARNTIAKYEEKSPLYGLIIYRRRKCLIKFIPEGTSRLLQARTAVHFQDVLERYSPYETLLEFSTPEGLNDTALAASFPLHTASPSTSSSRLHEISEDAEDGGAGAGGGGAPRPTNPSSSTGAIFDRPAPSSPVTNETRSRSPPAPLPKPSVSQFLVREDSGKRSITSLSSQPSITESAVTAGSDSSTTSSVETVTTSNDLLKSQPRASQAPSTNRSSQVLHTTFSSDQPTERIASISSEKPLDRPKTSDQTSIGERSKFDDYDPYDFSKFDYKPKVKLGPRPVVATEQAKRPTPIISSVPAGYRPAPPKKQESVRPKSQGPMGMTPALSPVFVPAPPPIPDVPEYSPRPVSRGSVKSLPSHKSGAGAMTPDKIRLMKAVELRKRQLRKSNSHQGKFVLPKYDMIPEVPLLLEQEAEADPVKMTEKELEKISIPTALPQPVAIEQLQPNTKKPDSGIEMDYDRSVNDDRNEQVGRGWQSSSPQPTLESAAVESTPAKKPDSRERSPVLGAEPPASPGAFEPTMSPDMLENLPVPTPMLREQMSREQMLRDTPTLDILNEGRTNSSREMMGLPTVPKIVMADGSRPISAISVASEISQQSAQGRILSLEFTHESGSESNGSQILLENLQSPKRGSDLARRRRGVVEPLHIETGHDDETDLDDELYDELQSATFQEATPIHVGSMPLPQSFDRRPSIASLKSASAQSVKSIHITHRTSSFPLDRSGDVSDATTPVSSSPISPPIAEENTVSTEATPADERADQLAKRNVSTGISKRIQALAEMSTRDVIQQGHHADVRPLSPETVNEFQQSDERAGSLRSQPRSRTSSYRHSKRASNNTITSPTMNHLQSSPITTSGRNSVSVTARIIRPSQGADTASEDSALQQSELVINHKRASTVPKLDARLPRIDTDMNPPLSKPSASSSSSPPHSGTSSPAASPTARRGRSSTILSANLKSMGRHKKQSSLGPSLDEFPPPPPSPMITSGTSFMNWGDENASPKEGSRTSRFFKRMSSLGANKRRSIAQPSITETSSSTTDAASNLSKRASSVIQERETPPAVVVGDLNVQFPDSLLWKRRIVEIDGAGNLVFSSPHALDIQKGLAKRYPFTDFRIPLAPDLDRQELPCSVMLDFIDGTTLQVACEDTMAHRQVLYTLRTYWKAWAGA